MRRKSQIAIILCLTACALLLLAAPALAQPTDIQGHWANQQVSKWVDSGYISGYPDGTFKPDNSITRAEFMALVNNAFGFTAETGTNFSDVLVTDWFYAHIGRAQLAGYITGYEDGTIRPMSQISRQEAAVIIARLLKLESAPSLIAISDAADVTQWSSGQVGAVLGNGIMRGYPDKTFRPFNPLSRAEAVVILNASLAVRHGPPAGVPPIVKPPVVTPPVVTPVGGGGGGGGGGSSAPTVTGAIITVDGADHDAAITLGKTGTISFATHNPSFVLSEGRIKVNRACTLELTIPANKFLDYSLDIKQDLKAGWNKLDVFEYLGAIYPDGGFTLAKMREVFDDSDTVTFDGVLTAGTESVNVSLAVTLP